MRVDERLGKIRSIYLIWKENQITTVFFKEFKGTPLWCNVVKRTILPDRSQSRASEWRRSESRGHCGRLAAPAGGRANAHLPPEPDPSADAQVWSNRGSLRTPADCLPPTRARGEAREKGARHEGKVWASVSHRNCDTYMHERVGGNVKMIYLRYNRIKNAVEHFKSSIFSQRIWY